VLKECSLTAALGAANYLVPLKYEVAGGLVEKAEHISELAPTAGLDRTDPCPQASESSFDDAMHAN
jgi:hypothetical protein